MCSWLGLTWPDALAEVLVAVHLALFVRPVVFEPYAFGRVPALLALLRLFSLFEVVAVGSRGFLRLRAVCPERGSGKDAENEPDDER